MCLLVLCVNCLFVKHIRWLIGYFGVAKTLDVLHEQFYWSKMKKDVQRIYEHKCNHMDCIHNCLYPLNLG